MSPVNNKQSGMTLIEVLFSVLLTGIVLLGLMGLLTHYNEQKWTQEVIDDVRVSKEVAAELIRAELPRSIPVNSSVSPLTNPSIWQCPSGGPCRLTSDNKTEGIEIIVDCQSTANIPVLEKTSFQNVTNLGPNCSSCGAGKRPIMTIKQYSVGKSPREIEIPNSKVENKSKGIIGMGMCLSAPVYQENIGTDAAKNMVDRYDHWKVTLMPVYLSLPPKPRHSANGYASILKVAPEEILLAPISQLGSKMMIVK